jgi:hypothetical protein
MRRTYGAGGGSEHTEARQFFIGREISPNENQPPASPVVDRSNDTVKVLNVSG